MFDAVHGKEGSKKKRRSQIQSYPPLGLCYLSSYMISKGIIDVEIIDCVERDFTSDRCAEYIINNGFNVVGISVTSFSLKEVKSIIDVLRKRKMDIKIVLGGVHVTYHPDIVRILGADYGIRGDGEESFYKIVTNFNKNIEGLVFIDQGVVKYNQPARIDDLDILPLPQLIDHDYKFPIFSGAKIYILTTSRGCPYKCTFCGLPNLKEKFRVESVEKTIQQLERLKAHKYEFCDFKDDIFTLDRQRIVDLCYQIIGKNLEMKWSAQTRADLVDFELLELMKKAGCYFLQFGVESGVERIRNEILKKNLSDEAIFNAVKMCKKVGIKTAALTLIGSPTETLDDMRSTVKFVKDLKPDYMDVLLTVPILGSELYEKCVIEKRISENIWEEIIKDDKAIPVYVPDGVNLEDMKKIQSNAYRSFYFNGGRILKECLNIRSFRQFLMKMKIAYSIIRNY